MKSVNVSLRIEEDVKKEAELLFGELGMSFSSAVNIFLKQAIREQAIPFEIRKNKPNAVTQAAMKAAETQEGLSGPFDTVEDLMEALNA